MFSSSSFLFAPTAASCCFTFRKSVTCSSSSNSTNSLQIIAKNTSSRFLRFSSSSSSTVSSSSSSSSASLLPTLTQMEQTLRRQLGPQSQLNVREQSRRNYFLKRERNKATRLDTIVVPAPNEEDGAGGSDSSSPSSAAAVTTTFRSSVTFRQCGFNVTLCTAESAASAEDAIRKAYNIAVATDISFFNPTLRPHEAQVFDRVRFLALGMGKMIRFSIGGGGDRLMNAMKTAAAPSSSSTSKEAPQAKADAEDDGEGEEESVSLFTCTAYIKSDWDIGLRGGSQHQQQKDNVLVTTAGKTAQDAFVSAVESARERLTKETEEGYHALEDVRELQLALKHGLQEEDVLQLALHDDDRCCVSFSNNKNTNNHHHHHHLHETGNELLDNLFAFLSSSSSSDSSPSSILTRSRRNESVFASNSSSSSSQKLLHPELFYSTNNNNNNSSNKSNNNNNNHHNKKNYTARVTVTDSSGNSYFVKSGDINRSALAAYRSCTLQIYKKESFVTMNQQQRSPSSSKCFFAQIQWQVEHLAWYSGLARSLSWDLHYRASARSSFQAAKKKNKKQQQLVKGDDSSSSSSPSAAAAAAGGGGGGAPVYLHATLHIGPVELAFADGVGRYRVMLNCYCNALERLLSNLPPSLTHSLALPTVDALYAAYSEMDRFQPADALKGAIKGLNPQTVLGAVTNLHLGGYYQSHWERMESQKYQGSGAGGGPKEGQSEDVCFVTAKLPNLESELALGDASTIKPGTKAVVLGRTYAAKFACAFALRDNFPLVYHQVKDRPDFKHGTERDNERKRQMLRTLPREKRIVLFDNLLVLLKELGAEDHSWSDVDVECTMRNSTMWIATCFARLQKDGTTRELIVSRPTSTKVECRKRVVLETAFKYYPNETQFYLSSRREQRKQEEYSQKEIAEVMGTDLASSLKPYDPAFSLHDQLVSFLNARAEPGSNLKICAEIVNFSSSSSSSSVSTQEGQSVAVLSEREKFLHSLQHASSSSSTSSSSSSSSSSAMLSTMKKPCYRVAVMTSSSGDSTNSHSRVVLVEKTSLPGASLFQTVRECVETAASSKLQLDVEKIRLLLSSFEDYKIPNLFRPQDLAEWLIRANVGLEDVRTDVCHSQKNSLWCGSVSVRMPVFESPPSLRLGEWVEVSRGVATTKRDAIKFCFMRAALTNCFAHLNYLSKKSLEQQADADAVLSADLEQFHSMMTSSQLQSFMRLTPSCIAVLRSTLKAEGLVLRISVVTHKNNSSSSSSSSYSLEEASSSSFQQTYECTLFSFPAKKVSSSDSLDKILARGKSTSSADGALEAAARNALDDLLSDDDLKFWSSRWALEVEDPITEVDVPSEQVTDY